MKVYGSVNFDKKVSDWDGFGFNYVETAQAIDYTTDPQDYGGFSIITKEEQEQIMQLVFGKDGLKPSTVKMFLDPFHQTEENINKDGVENIDQSNYDHETTTKQMRHFVKRGLEITREDGRDLEIVTTLYGPPPFMTKAKVMRGRDLQPKYEQELSKYMAAWAQYLKNDGYPIKYISIHNEGEDYVRWNNEHEGNIGTGHDYNLWHTPEDVASRMISLRKVLDANGMEDIGVTPGENTNWTRFYNWGYAGAIIDSKEATDSLGLITSHGFSSGVTGDIWHGDHRSVGIDLIREQKPGTHAWVNSTSWAKMDAAFLLQSFGNIYSAKVNSIIPWAGIQRPSLWVGGDPNPGNAIQINDDSSIEVRNGYYYYKQLCPIGQAGMSVVRTSATRSTTGIIAFESNGTKNPNAFVIINSENDTMDFEIKITGTKDSTYSTYATSQTKKAEDTGDYTSANGILKITLEPDSAMTFIQK